jgi:tetratricopeptide (TPR) repeat protein
VTRTLCLACCFTFFFADAAFSQLKSNPQTQNPPKATSPAATSTAPSQSSPDEANPPEEDESVAPEKFALDPLESDRNLKVGDYYWHKGKYRAALGRYERATKYNPSSAEAFFKVGEAEQKLKNQDAAKIAFQRVIQLAPDSKLAHDARKKLSSKS